MSTKTKNQRGASIVEFAFSLPVLLVLLIGIMKCGTTFNHWITLTESVAVAGRTLSVSRLSNPSGCDLATTAFQSAGVTLPGIGSVTPSYSFTGGGGSSCTTGLVAGDSATVSASYACDLKILWYNFAPGCTLPATIVERIE
jgi:Flp pilus assembly protein TadG